MITFHDGDIFNTKADYICHQVNCQGVMGSGIAKQVKQKYPEVFKVYKEVCESEPSDRNLGSCLFTKCNDGKTIINMFAQDKYGRDRRYTDYFAFAMCLQYITENLSSGTTIAIPFNIGCGTGGADWSVIYDMINSALGECYNIEIWKL